MAEEKDEVEDAFDKELEGDAEEGVDELVVRVVIPAPSPMLSTPSSNISSCSISALRLSRWQ